MLRCAVLRLSDKKAPRVVRFFAVGPSVVFIQKRFPVVGNSVPGGRLIYYVLWIQLLLWSFYMSIFQKYC